MEKHLWCAARPSFQERIGLVYLVCVEIFFFFFTQKTHKINKACTPYNFIVITECMLVNLKHLKLLCVAGTLLLSLFFTQSGEVV